jgi:hypothetical protein
MYLTDFSFCENSHPQIDMTRLNRILPFFSALLLLVLSCDAIPVLEKRESAARQVLDTRSYGPPIFGQPITSVRSPSIIPHLSLFTYLFSRLHTTVDH